MEQSRHLEEIAAPKEPQHHAHVDEAIARKVAANVDDFMVNPFAPCPSPFALPLFSDACC